MEALAQIVQFSKRQNLNILWRFESEFYTNQALEGEVPTAVSF